MRCLADESGVEEEEPPQAVEAGIKADRCTTVAVPETRRRVHDRVMAWLQARLSAA